MRGNIRSLIAVAAIAAIAGCSDSATSPSDATSRTLAPGDRPSLDYNGPSRFGGFRTTTFTLTSSGGKFEVGDLYTIRVPANAVCSLNSSYGAGTWDSPCTTLKSGQSIKVTATYGFANGGPVVNFSPDLRFSPSSQVTIESDMFAPILTGFRWYYESNPSALRYFGVYYTENLGETGRAESSFDQTMVSHISLKTGLVWRRIKHFSGYNVTSGLACDPTPSDPNCIEGDAPRVDP